MTNAVIQKKIYELQFLQRAEKQGFAVIDTDFIEALHWTQLSQDDLTQMQERSVWQNETTLYALRNDFTDQLKRYYAVYQRHHDLIAYSGPIARHHKVAIHLGLECYEPTIQHIQSAYQFFKSFIESVLHDQIDYVVLGHFELIHLLLGTKAEDRTLLNLLEQRNMSALATYLNVSHPLIQLLNTPTDAQLDKLHTLYPEDHRILQSLTRWTTFLKQEGITNIHLDITPQPPRSYYKGTFIKSHLCSGKVLSGGFYHDGLKGFGLGLTLDEKEDSVCSR
ncbi:ATP phosphoribosyltransferase regulatory subunit [Staphylococcus agnetis]|uniref:ATP phosphoribosyltransferase regulatory subunit n=1 Tax=Staphylococcus agnetis TaxID=985762 RepID=UPI000E0747F8|nr:ATP phosphoribosyltransferase regulatory subunit [Staphylococcus agnetis]SUK04900.1 ATP phosphoribosyltransferase regulatory subunit [Staphylococcus agnetis]